VVCGVYRLVTRTSPHVLCAAFTKFLELSNKEGAEALVF
jgi:hypothetical protein